jgi:hypothetical protein
VIHLGQSALPFDLSLGNSAGFEYICQAAPLSLQLTVGHNNTMEIPFTYQFAMSLIIPLSIAGDVRTGLFLSLATRLSTDNVLDLC